MITQANKMGIETKTIPALRAYPKRFFVEKPQNLRNEAGGFKRL
jgi:hypothetical protein